MRVEDIVGVSFFGVLIPAVVATIYGARASVIPGQRAMRIGWGLGAIGFALIGFGLVSFVLIHNSARPVVEGNLWHVREMYSSKSRSTRFRITDASSHAVQIWCDYTGPGLREGERARVRYVAYNRKLVEMDMLSGPYKNWHLQESVGEFAFLGWAAIGVGCGFFAYRQLAKGRRGETTA